MATNEVPARDDYGMLARRARELYGQGRSAPEALGECYGVDLPAEVFLIAGSDLEARGPSVRFPHQPWRLIPAAGSTEVPLEPAGSDRIERALLRHDPDLFPLVFLTNRDARHGHSLLCYRMSDVAATHSAVYGVPGAIYRVPETWRVTRLGESLLIVLREYFVDIRDRMALAADLPSAWGTDAIPSEELERADGFVDLIDWLRGAAMG